MSGAKKSTWIGGTVFVALVLAAAAWFFAISPTLAAAAEVRDEVEQTNTFNDLLEMRVAKLAADFEKLPEYRAQLESIRTQIPADAELAAYVRELDAIATAHSVTITAVSPGTPELVTVVVQQPAAPEPTTTEGEEPTGTDAEQAAEAGAGTTTAAPATPPSFTAIPFSITVLGTYDNVLAFVADLQAGTPRLMYVGGLLGTSQKAAEAGGGKPATADGDLELVITGQTYVLPDALAAAQPVDPAAPVPALPGAVPGKNPLVPVPGR
ncbi:hypothetical protein [Cellulomonas fimi]|uniref:Tfp pilus assembly protein PilO n=1 Tax=Cellulomonas fimi (strain ATCC 484 / DSM 20113 / JCM 1341 / CCUG 24087 / LMG 16345 / NBRC 15513 / NCIMB 8980 / NCTC 7547 / NRS-133) TaxID=590998 RepID=F4H077_CELFA|nr:hypothetical protein [Cellulomonas fimi]AEE46124.1 hypothetical protein Celf_1994 [Cellulomonas fimi ATCC 484]NNH08430.1 hypothetical protein [Cellulomonas fimi]VEH31728.1 Pilus assembly protein, PilO [Cellulomonas fimi]